MSTRYLRAEVPLHIVPTTHISQPCLESLVQLPSILSQEEEEAYKKTLRVRSRLLHSPNLMTVGLSVG